MATPPIPTGHPSTTTKDHTFARKITPVAQSNPKGKVQPASPATKRRKDSDPTRPEHSLLGPSVRRQSPLPVGQGQRGGTRWVVIAPAAQVLLTKGGHSPP